VKAAEAPVSVELPACHQSAVPPQATLFHPCSARQARRPGTRSGRRLLTAMEPSSDRHVCGVWPGVVAQSGDSPRSPGVPPALPGALKMRHSRIAVEVHAYQSNSSVEP
jgi:hypothetical protein